MDSANHYDVIVAGGGMAGCAAAISSARLGCRTLLIDQFGFLGGWATAALVNPFMTHRTSDGRPLVAGIFSQINQSLEQERGLLGNCFDTEALILALQEMVIGSSASLRLHTFCAGVRQDEAGLIALRTVSKSGEEEFVCTRLIDCTGDGDLAVALGAGYESSGEDGLQQAATLMFDVGGVDLQRALAYVRDNPDQMRFPKLEANSNLGLLADQVVAVAGYYELVRQARQAGDYSAPGDLIFYISRPRKGEVTFNTTHIGNIDGTNSADLTRAEVEGRRQMMSIVRFVNTYVPGFENSYLIRSAAHVGIRETRRIVGEYRFSAADVTHARKFNDAICRLAYPVDVHSGKGEGYTKEEEILGVQAPPEGDWYEIPYRCLLPRGIAGVLIAGRCVSSTQAGHGAIRIMPACVAMGEAAGTAAALSIQKDCLPSKLAADDLQPILRQHGAIV